MRQKITEKTFEGQSIFVGIDVHRKDFKLTVMVEDMFYKTFTSPPKAEAVVSFLRNNFPGANYYTAYEAGFSGFGLHWSLLENGVNSIVVNPSDIPTTDKDRQQKEDKRDSRKIADSLRCKQLKPIYVPDKRILHDRTLLRTRDKVVRDNSRCMNRIKSMLYFHGIGYPPRFSSATTHRSKAFLNWLETLEFDYPTGRMALQVLLEQLRNQRGLLLKINRQIRELSSTADYKTNYDLLITVPGVGPITVMRLLTELGTIYRFRTFNHLCSYVGLVPSTASSGDNWKDKGITQRRNVLLRTALIESAWVAIRNDPAMLAFYRSHCNSKEDSNPAIVRVAKKLLNRIRHVWLTQEPYEKGIIK